MRQPPSGAAVACRSSSKPSSGVGRTAAARRRAGRRPEPSAHARRCARRRPRGRPRRGSRSAEAGRPRRHDVARPLGHGRVGVVDHERHASCPGRRRGTRARAAACAAGPSRRARASPGTAVAVERRLARALHAAQDHRLHSARRYRSRRDPLPRTGRAHAARVTSRANSRPCWRSTRATRSSSARWTPAGASSPTKAAPYRPRPRARARGRRPRAHRPGRDPRRAAGDDAAHRDRRRDPGRVGRLPRRRLASRPSTSGSASSATASSTPTTLDAATMTGRSHLGHERRAAPVPRRDGDAARRARRALDDPAARAAAGTSTAAS